MKKIQKKEPTYKELEVIVVQKIEEINEEIEEKVNG